MAQYDVYPSTSGIGFLLDCQSDLIGNLSHRLMVPLLPEGQAPIAARKLNPVFTVGWQRVVMTTQFSAAVPRVALGRPIGSLDDQHFTIIAALDVLLNGI